MPGKYTYNYPRPSVATDCVIFGFDGEKLNLLLVERGAAPFMGCWALPGGFIHQDETLEQCAARELREETNLKNVYLEQFKAYSKVDRDPRTRVISVAFIALVRPSDYEVIAGDDAANAFWFDIKQLPPLAFDHLTIVKEAREHLKEVLVLKPIAFNLLNKYFSLGELQKVYEVINDTIYDRRNFSRSVQESGIVEPTDVKPAKARNRPPKLFQASPMLEEMIDDETKEIVTAASDDDMAELSNAEIENCFADMCMDKDDSSQINSDARSISKSDLFSNSMTATHSDADMTYCTPPGDEYIALSDLMLPSPPPVESLKRKPAHKESSTKGLFDFLRRRK
ncbi:MAG: NUDIX hydrolase [Muribaculaceae bacterium]|nr:NUDIX hydrolase [Muribaculaceae bacterium]MDE6754415.1 NUDIX hydrolase [Muribaculaceae bacterium]